MTKTDLQQISGLLEKQKTEIISLVDQKLEKQTKEIDQKLEKQTKEINLKLEKQTKEILEGVADYMADSWTPLLEKHDDRISHLEHHTIHPPGTSVII